MKSGFHWEHIVGGIGFLGLISAHVYGLFLCPPDSHMGDVARILFVHVPAALNTMAIFTVAFVAALVSLVSGRRSWDWLLAGALEVGLLLSVITIITGSIFAHPTWNIWWTWDPRLTSTAILMLSFVGVLLLRSLVHDPSRRATWTAVVTIISYVNVPITYMSVRWMRSIHQLQSSPADVDGPFKLVWRLGGVALFLFAIWLITRRWRLERARDLAAQPMPLPKPGGAV